MINFSTAVSPASTFVVAESTGLFDSYFDRIKEALVITMGGNLRSLTPSQVEVLADFDKWVIHNKGATIVGRETAALLRSDTKPLVKPIFFYVNLNEGHSMAVIWADAKGKVSYLG
jgi:hypothetical protein